MTRNSKHRKYVATSPLDLAKMSLVPNPDKFDEPSTCRVHSFSESDLRFSSFFEFVGFFDLSLTSRSFEFSLFGMVHSRTKSAKI